MKQIYFCVFGGTTEGRLIAEFLTKQNIKTDLFIATEYGEQFVKDIENVNIHQKRVDKAEMIELFQKNGYSNIIDATHPFAVEVSKNIHEAADFCGIALFRIIRPDENHKDCIYVNNLQEAISLLNETDENIFLTTGSKNLKDFVKINNYAQRIFLRILPMENSLKEAIGLGYANKNIICMQGPFSEDINIAMLNHTHAKYMVTKESASSGGLSEKISACNKAGCKCIVIKKPDEKGITVDELESLIKKEII